MAMLIPAIGLAGCSFGQPVPVTPPTTSEVVESEPAQSSPSERITTTPDAETSPAEQTTTASSATSSAAPANNFTEDNPAPLGQWVEISAQDYANRKIYNLNMRVTAIHRWDTDQKYVEDCVNEYNERNNVWKLNLTQDDKPDIHWAVAEIEYEIPQNSTLANPLYSAPGALSVSFENLASGGIPSAIDRATYIGVGGVGHEMDDKDKPESYDKGSKRHVRVLYDMVDGYENYVIEAKYVAAINTDNDYKTTYFSVH